MLGEVLENCQGPCLVGAAIAPENRLLDARHSCVRPGSAGQFTNNLAPFAIPSRRPFLPGRTSWVRGDLISRCDLSIPPGRSMIPEGTSHMETTQCIAH
jgi:hypothetical protein